MNVLSLFYFFFESFTALAIASPRFRTEALLMIIELPELIISVIGFTTADPIAAI